MFAEEKLSSARRWTGGWVALLVGGWMWAGLGCDGCKPTPAPLKLVMPVASSEVVLRTERAERGGRWEPAEVELTQAVAFAIPESFAPRRGTCLDCTAEFRYRDTQGVEVRCIYKAVSSGEFVPPSQESLRFTFQQCSPAQHVGTSPRGIWFELHIDDPGAEDGDNNDEQDSPNQDEGAAEVELRLGGTPVLEPPLTPAESAHIRDTFSWSLTQPLPELTAEGLPTLYYAMIYVEDRDQLAALDELQLHHSGLPLLASELERWRGQRGTFLHEGDGQGIFRYAIIPGIVYNLLRQAALDGKVVYRVIQLRDIPAKARAADGSFSYDVLRASGFRYRGEEPPTMAGQAGSDLGRTQQPLFNSIIRTVVTAIATVAEEVKTTVLEEIGQVDILVKGSVKVTVALDVRNTDPLFGGRLASGRSTPMLRAWGPNAGQQVQLPGVHVYARQMTLGGVLPANFDAWTGEDGRAHMEVARETETVFCVATENAAARVTNFLTAVEVCSFQHRASQFVADVDISQPLQHGYFNVLAQATEGYAYLRDIVGFTPHRAIILVGPFAELWGLASKGTAPCFGFPNLSYESLIAVLASTAGAIAGPQVGVALLAAGPIYAVDIILASDPRYFDSTQRQAVETGTYDGIFDSRLATTHEYGHFAFCSLLYEQGAENISLAYAQASIQRMGNPPPSAEAGYINEGFADFFASQVAGGTNYFHVPQTIIGPGAYYCRNPSSSTSSCLDEGNVTDPRPGSPMPFYDQVGRVATTLLDAFDGWTPHTNAPENGSIWTLTEGANALVTFDDTPPTHANDEGIKLPGPAVRELISRWRGRSAFISDDTFLGGLSDTMEAAGYGWCQRCDLFLLHDTHISSSPSPGEKDARCQAEPIRRWIGPKPSETMFVYNLQPGPEDGKDAFVSNAGGVELPSYDTNFGQSDLVVSWHNSTPLSPAHHAITYLQFDLSQVKHGSDVARAVLMLKSVPYLWGPPPSESNVLVVRQVTSHWDESSVTWNTRPAVTEVGAVAVPVVILPDHRYNIDIDIDVTEMVRGMLTGSTPNHGFMLQLETPEGDSSFLFSSSEAKEPHLRPTLRLEYTGCW